MKAFVIKNKEGKYLRGTYGKNGEYCWTKDIVDAMTYGVDEFVPQPIENYMLVPITIAEGDLEEENKALKRALELCVNVLQREIDGDYINATEVQAIYEIGKDYFIEQAKGEEV